MHRSFLLLGSVLAALLFATEREARGVAVTLTFDDATCDGGQACGDGGEIDASYGDIPGQLDVISDRDLDSALVGPLQFWGTGYGSLVDVAFGAGVAGTQTAEIFLQPLGGASVRLLGLDLGAWSGTRDTQVTILDGAGGLLWSSGAIQVAGTTSLPFDLESADGIRIQWGPTAYYVAIDNLSFELVPEPGSLALVLLALTLLGRRAAASAWGRA